jgi:hypothetical protein
MAFLYITEFENAGSDASDRKIPVGQFPPLAEQKIAVAVGSTASATLNERTTLIRLHTDLACSFDLDVAPTATVSNARMAIGTTEYITVPRKSGLKIAVIAN